MERGERVSRELRDKVSSEDLEQTVRSLDREGLLDMFEGYLLAQDISLSLCGSLVILGSPAAKNLRGRLESLREEAASLLSALSRSSGKGGFPFSGGIPSELVSEADRAVDFLLSELERATHILLSEAFRLMEPARESVLRKAKSLLESLGEENIGGVGDKWNKMPDLISALEQLPPPSSDSPPGDVRDYASLVSEAKSIVVDIEERLSRSKKAREKLGLALAELESTIEELRRELSAAEEEGIRAEFVAETLEWALVRAKRLKRRCAPGDFECVEKTAEEALKLRRRIGEMAESSIKELRGLIDLMREVTNLVPEAESASEALGRELSSRSLRLIVRDVAAELSGYMGGVTIRDSEELKRLRDRLLEIREVLRSLISLEKASEEAGGLEEMASRIADGPSSLAIIKAVLAKAEEDPRILTREALPALKEFGERISEYREAQRDAKRLYPYWKRYLLRVVEENGGEVDVDSLKRIPARWLPWFLKRIESEGVAVVTGNKIRIPAVSSPAPTEVRPRIKAGRKVEKIDLEKGPAVESGSVAVSPTLTQRKETEEPLSQREGPAVERKKVKIPVEGKLSPAHELLSRALTLLSPGTRASVPPLQADHEKLARRISTHLI